MVEGRKKSPLFYRSFLFVRGSIGITALYVKKISATENIGYKMWGEAQMTAPGIHSDIRSYEKSAYLLYTCCQKNFVPQH
jgi:hypothetical protein